jgi:hypothetical protein
VTPPTFSQSNINIIASMDWERLEGPDLISATGALNQILASLDSQETDNWL